MNSKQSIVSRTLRSYTHQALRYTGRSRSLQYGQKRPKFYQSFLSYITAKMTPSCPVNKSEIRSVRRRVKEESGSNELLSVSRSYGTAKNEISLPPGIQWYFRCIRRGDVIEADLPLLLKRLHDSRMQEKVTSLIAASVLSSPSLVVDGKTLASLLVPVGGAQFLEETLSGLRCLDVVARDLHGGNVLANAQEYVVDHLLQLGQWTAALEQLSLLVNASSRVRCLCCLARSTAPDISQRSIVMLLEHLPIVTEQRMDEVVKLCGGKFPLQTLPLIDKMTMMGATLTPAATRCYLGVAKETGMWVEALRRIQFAEKSAVDDEAKVYFERRVHQDILEMLIDLGRIEQVCWYVDAVSKQCSPPLFQSIFSDGMGDLLLKYLASSPMEDESYDKEEICACVSLLRKAFGDQWNAGLVEQIKSRFGMWQQALGAVTGNAEHLLKNIVAAAEGGAPWALLKQYVASLSANRSQGSSTATLILYRCALAKQRWEDAIRIFNTSRHSVAPLLQKELDHPTIRKHLSKESPEVEEAALRFSTQPILWAKALELCQEKRLPLGILMRIFQGLVSGGSWEAAVRLVWPKIKQTASPNMEPSLLLLLCGTISASGFDQVALHFLQHGGTESIDRERAAFLLHYRPIYRPSSLTSDIVLQRWLDTQRWDEIQRFVVQSSVRPKPLLFFRAVNAVLTHLSYHERTDVCTLMLFRVRVAPTFGRRRQDRRRRESSLINLVFEISKHQSSGGRQPLLPTSVVEDEFEGSVRRVRSNSPSRQLSEMASVGNWQGSLRLLTALHMRKVTPQLEDILCVLENFDREYIEKGNHHALAIISATRKFVGANLVAKAFAARLTQRSMPTSDWKAALRLFTVFSELGLHELPPKTVQSAFTKPILSVLLQFLHALYQHQMHKLHVGAVMSLCPSEAELIISACEEVGMHIAIDIAIVSSLGELVPSLSSRRPATSLTKNALVHSLMGTGSRAGHWQGALRVLLSSRKNGGTTTRSEAKCVARMIEVTAAKDSTTAARLFSHFFPLFNFIPPRNPYSIGAVEIDEFAGMENKRVAGRKRFAVNPSLSAILALSASLTRDGHWDKAVHLVQCYTSKVASLQAVKVLTLAQSAALFRSAEFVDAAQVQLQVIAHSFAKENAGAILRRAGTHFDPNDVRTEWLTQPTKFVNRKLFEDPI